MKLLISRQGNTTALPGKTEALLRKAARLCVIRMKADPRSKAGLVIMDDQGIQKLNLEFRGLDQPTDVLSFPTAEGERLGSPELSETGAGTGVIALPYLGDIAISAEKAAAQALAYGHSFDREMAFLTIHGMLHLMGLDHEADCEREYMEKLQRQIISLVMAGL